MVVVYRPLQIRPRMFFHNFLLRDTLDKNIRLLLPVALLGFIRYRWRLRHILVDEYQDTSPAQQRLLKVTLSTHTSVCRLVVLIRHLHVMIDKVGGGEKAPRRIGMERGRRVVQKTTAHTVLGSGRRGKPGSLISSFRFSMPEVFLLRPLCVSFLFWFRNRSSTTIGTGVGPSFDEECRSRNFNFNFNSYRGLAELADQDRGRGHGGGRGRRGGARNVPGSGRESVLRG